MGKCTERSPRTVARLLDVIALGGLVDLWMELLLCPSVAVTARVALITIGRVSPLVVQLDIGTRGGTVREREREREREYIQCSFHSIW